MINNGSSNRGVNARVRWMRHAIIRVAFSLSAFTCVSSITLAMTLPMLGTDIVSDLEGGLRGLSVDDRYSSKSARPIPPDWWSGSAGGRITSSSSASSGIRFSDSGSRNATLISS